MEERLNAIQEVTSINKAAEPEIQYRLNQDSSDYTITRIKSETKSSASFNPVNPGSDNYTSNLPEGWKYSTLNELKLFSIYGPRFSSKDYSINGIAVLRTTDITEGGKVKWDNCPKLPLSDRAYEKYKLLRNDLLITRTGSIGTVAIFNDNVKAIPGAFLIHYRIKNNVKVPYIFYFLKSDIAQKHFKKHSTGIGRPNLNVPNIEQLEIPIPSEEMQTQIVEEIEKRFSEADNLENAVDESLAKAETLRQSILKQAF